MKGHLLFPFSPFPLCLSQGDELVPTFDVSTSVVLTGRDGLIQLKGINDLR
jgi:hypothetical protein